MSKLNNTKLYAKALAELIWERPAFTKASTFAKATADKSAGEEKIVNNFVKFLVNKGYEGKSKEILDLAENLLLAKQGKRKITFETARNITSNQKKMIDSFVNKGDIVKEKINPELIAGIKIIINDSKQFDASMQLKLQKIL